MSTPPPGCATIRELLAAYALGALAPEEATAIPAHLRACPACRAEYAEFVETVALLRALPGASARKVSVHAGLDTPGPGLRRRRIRHDPGCGCHHRAPRTARATSSGVLNGVGGSTCRTTPSAATT